MEETVKKAEQMYVWNYNLYEQRELALYKMIWHRCVTWFDEFGEEKIGDQFTFIVTYMEMLLSSV